MAQPNKSSGTPLYKVQQEDPRQHPGMSARKVAAIHQKQPPAPQGFNCHHCHPPTLLGRSWARRPKWSINGQPSNIQAATTDAGSPCRPIASRPSSYGGSTAPSPETARGLIHLRKGEAIAAPHAHDHAGLADWKVGINPRHQKAPTQETRLLTGKQQLIT